MKRSHFGIIDPFVSQHTILTPLINYLILLSALAYTFPHPSQIDH